MNLYTYATIIDKLEQFATAHQLIKRFTHGQIAQADLEKEGEWAWMHVVPNSISFARGASVYSFDVFFADLPRVKDTKTDYQKYAISDCSQLFADLISQIAIDGFFGEQWVVQLPVTANPFIEEFTHVLSGVQGTINIEVPFDMNACDTPLSKPD